MFNRIEIILFLLFAYGFSWIVWGGLYWFSDISIQATVILGAFGPSLSGFVMAYRHDNFRGIKRLFLRSLQPNISIKYYAIILLFIPSLFFIAYWWTDGSGALLIREPWLIVPYFLYMLFLGGAVQEEYGWRGYLLDAFQSKTTPVRASVSLGFVWTTWHTPLFFMEGTGQSLLPFWAYLLAIMSYTVLMTWVYNLTKRNIWSALLMHTIFNVMLVMLGLIGENEYPIGFIHLAIILFTAALLVTWKTFGKLRYEPIEEFMPSGSGVMSPVRGGKE